MPETYFTIRWPDGSDERCYSPSTVITRFFEAGQSYPLPDFVHRARIALEKASDRVRERYGHPCSNAMAQLDRIEARAAAFGAQDRVTCLEITQ